VKKLEKLGNNILTRPLYFVCRQKIINNVNLLAIVEMLSLLIGLEAVLNVAGNEVYAEMDDLFEE